MRKKNKTKTCEERQTIGKQNWSVKTYVRENIHKKLTCFTTHYTSQPKQHDTPRHAYSRYRHGLIVILISFFYFVYKNINGLPRRNKNGSARIFFCWTPPLTYFCRRQRGTSTDSPKSIVSEVKWSEVNEWMNEWWYFFGPLFFLKLIYIIDHVYT